MSNEFDFESNDENPLQTNNGPINNGSNNGKGGVPLIAIIGIMALIILGLIIYIVVDETSTKDENVMNTQDYEVQTEIEETPVIEEEEEKVKNVVEEPEITDKEVEEDDEEETKTPISVTTNSVAELSSDWKSCEFAVEGKKYKLNDSYKSYTENGWYIDLDKMGYPDGYILNKNDKTYSTVDLLNDNFEDAEVSVGFINKGESAQDITECSIWAINVDNSYSDTPVDFELPGGIKKGSTLAEVEAAYGKPEEDDIYRSDDLGYTNYSYVYDYSIYLDLTIYDEEGLVEFDYKIYE